MLNRLFQGLIDLEQDSQHREPHIIHNDPSFGNVLFDGSQVHLIDYDDMKIGSGFIDLGVVLAGPLTSEDFHEKKEALFAGYNDNAAIKIGIDAWHFIPRTAR